MSSRNEGSSGKRTLFPANDLEDEELQDDSAVEKPEPFLEDGIHDVMQIYFNEIGRIRKEMIL